MEHQMAVETKASERYLLEEMTEAERLEFEAHFFECEACAEDVRSGEILVRGVKAVGDELPQDESKKASSRNWRGWLFPGSLVPSAAAVAMTVVAGYQTFVVLPPLRETVRPQAVEAVVLRPVARGEEPRIQLSRSTGVSVLTLDVNTGEPGQAIRWELSPPDGKPPISGNAKVPAAGAQLQLWVPNATLQNPGSWSLVLKNSEGAETGRYAFQLEILK